MFKNEIADILNKLGIDRQTAYETLVAQDQNDKGDYSLPCFKFAKEMRKSPVQIADELAKNIKADFIERVEPVSGYINFFIDKAVFARRAVSGLLARGEQIGASDSGQGKTICIDYSSINIAKPFHIGHLSTTVIGGSLYRIFKKLGYNVVGINHLGDWGTQFGKLIYAYKNWSNETEIDKGGINEMLRLYVKFHDEAEVKPELNDAARAWFLKIEQGDAEALAIFNKFRDKTLNEVGKTYEQLGVTFDSYNGESFFNDKMDEVIEILDKKGLTQISDGATIVNLDDYKMPPCLIKRSDGASLYATRDIAAVLYRKRTYNYDKSLYVVATQQNLHFQQVFKVIELMGAGAEGLVHVPFGMVSLEEGSMSTRKGRVVFLQDVLDKAVNKTLTIINEKNPQLENKERCAEMVGRGAVIFSALANQRIKDVVFSYDKVLNFEGETGPYIQYTHARACSVLRKGQTDGEIDYNCLTAEDTITDEASIALIKQLMRFEPAVALAADKYEPSVISKVLIDISQTFNKFYFDNKIITDDSATRNARLALTLITKNILKSGLELLLLQAPEQM